MDEMTETPYLKPCPFCGATQGQGGLCMNSDQEGADIWVCYVDCLDCGASGGATSDVKIAAAEWNRRAAT